MKRFWTSVLLLVFAAGVVLFLRAAQGNVTPDQTGNILKNASFEDESRGLPAVWNLEAKAKPKGAVSLSTTNAHSGRVSLKLEPNGRNQPWDLSNDPLALGQGFPAGSFQGKRVYVSAWLAAEGDAAAVIDVVALGGRMPALVELKQTSAKPGLVFREDVLLVPDDAKYLVFDCVVQGTSGAAYFDDVFLSGTVPASWGKPGEAQAAPGVRTPRPSSTTTAGTAVGRPLEAQVAIDASAEIRRIPSTLYGTNIEWIWNGNGLWNERARSLDPDLVRLTSDLHPSLLRFPGGILSDFYHWRDAIGQSRQPLSSLPGDSPQAPNFGTDEALEFAAKTGAQLLITVNAGTGTAQEAADWVRYVNKGSRRVTYWEVGNEIYVKMGHPGFVKSTMPPDAYARKVVEFAAAMRAVDPGIQVGAIGDENFGALSPRAYGDWTSTVLGIAGNAIDFLAVHDGYAPVLIQDKGQSVRKVYEAMLGAPDLVRQSLAKAASKIASRVPSRASHIRLAVTEWGPYFQMTPDGRFVDHVKTLGSALYTASAMKVFIESPQTDVATGFKLVDELYQGWIGRRQGKWIAKAPYYALQLYTRHFGQVLLRSTTQVDSYDSQPVGLVDALSAVPYLDVVSSRSEDGRTLFVMAINKHFDLPIEARLSLTGCRPSGAGVAWTLNGSGIDANTGTELFKAPGVNWARQAADEKNPRIDQGSPDDVKVTSAPLSGVTTAWSYSFPAHSVTALEIALR